ncbi:hypothetical protein TRFO_02654 [Tritrichomonas foetus]|uniref:BEACH domain-containing protein n=1 Tax=Tritrichomonas foetus TaxID=1144522 RepID=A0A1J4KYT2_9EUKA|nr:hypothetical protein TRFO_02654 [Tritrichomonas foetus]|eukprot:OHT16411.1 hypothetical protein TRFO_02654 [Tritrichomonas foetus]
MSIETYIEEIQDNLKNLKDQPKEEQIKTLFISFPSFLGLLKLIDDESNIFFQQSLGMMKECIEDIQSLFIFCSDLKYNDMIYPILIKFLRSKIFGPKLALDLSTLTNNYFFFDFQCSSFIPLSLFISEFLSNQIFIHAFEISEGIHAICNLFVNETKTEICQLSVNSIVSNLKYYYVDNEEEIIKIMNKILDLLPMVPFVNSSALFKFLFHFTVCRPFKFMNFLIREKFDLINKYIQSDSEGNLLFVYSYFYDVKNNLELYDCIEPLFIQLINLINNSNTQPIVKKKALDQLKVFLSEYSSFLPIPVEKIYTISQSIDHEDTATILAFFDIIKYISTHITLDLIVLVPTIHQFITIENAFKIDISDAFEIMNNTGNEFHKIAISFFQPLLKNRDSTQLRELFLKYPRFLSLFFTLFSEASINEKEVNLLLLLFSTRIYDAYYDIFCETLSKILEYESIFPLIIPKIENKMTNDQLELLLKVAGKTCRYNFKVRINWLGNRVLRKITQLMETKQTNQENKLKGNKNNEHHHYRINPLVLFDLIASLTSVKFMPKFDLLVYEILETYQYFDQSEESIRKLAFGCLQEEKITDDSFLVLPSILYKCGNFEIKSPTDCYVCSQYGIDAWVNKTNKSLEQFPSFKEISKRYIKSDHFANLLPRLINSKSFLEYLGNDFDNISLFEFHKGINDTKMNLQISIRPEDSITLSFWIYIPNFSSTHQQLFQISELSISVCGNKIFDNSYDLNNACNQQEISTFLENKWYNFVVCFSNNKIELYLNSDLKYAKICGVPTEIAFGTNEKNAESWYIGGFIRSFFEKIDLNNIHKIHLYDFNLRKFTNNLDLTEANKSIQEGSDQHNIFEHPYIGIDNFKPKDDSNLRLSQSSSFLNYLSIYIGGSHGFFREILKNLNDNKPESFTIAFNLFHAMIMNQKINGNKENISDFALDISILAHYKTSLFDDVKIFDEINQCFSNDQCAYWKYVFTFYLDLTLIEKDFILEKIIKLIEDHLQDFNRKKHKISESVLRFLVSSLVNKEIKCSHFLIYKLIRYFLTDTKGIYVYMNILNDIYIDSNIKNLKNEKQLLSNQFNGNDELAQTENRTHELIYQEFFLIIKELIILNFDNLHILHQLKPYFALEFCYLLLTVQPKIGSLIDKKFIMRFCIANVEDPRAWNCAITLLICSPTDFITNPNFEFDTLDISLIPSFSIMLCVLFSVVHDFTQDSIWYKLARSMISFIESTIDAYQKSDQTLFALMHMLIFNMFSEMNTTFPFAPGLNKYSEVARKALSRSQFISDDNLSTTSPHTDDSRNDNPNTDSNHNTCAEAANKSEINFDIKESSILLNNTTEIECDYMEVNDSVEVSLSQEKCNELTNLAFFESISMIPPYSNQIIDTSSIPFYLNDCSYVSNQSLDKYWDSLKDFVEEKVNLIKFEGKKNYPKHIGDIKNEEKYIKTVHLSLLTVDVLHLVSSYLFSLIESPDEFLNSLRIMTTCLNKVKPNHFIFVLQKICTFLLHECITEQFFSLELIEFVCEKAKEGLFADQLAPVVSLMISLCKETDQSSLPDSLYSLIFLGFEIVPFHRFPIFCEIFISYEYLIFSDRNCCNPQFFYLLIENILKYQTVNPESFRLIWKLVQKNIEVYQRVLSDKWFDNHFDYVKKFIDEISEDGFSKYSECDFINNSQYYLFLKDFKEFRQKQLNEFISDQYQSIINSLKNTVVFIHENRQNFVQFTNNILGQLQSDILVANAIHKNLKIRFFNVFLFDCEMFYRIREKHITETQVFEHNLGTEKSLVVLSAQLFPPMRVERSVLILNKKEELLHKIIPRNIVVNDNEEIINENSLILSKLSCDCYPIEMILHSPEQIRKLVFSQRIQSYSINYIQHSLGSIPTSQHISNPNLNHYQISELTNSRIPCSIFGDSLLYHELELLHGKIDFHSDALFLYGSEPIFGTILKTQDSKLIFIEGMKIESFAFRENDIVYLRKNLHFINPSKTNHQNRISLFAYYFYINYFVSGYFGPCSLFCGHPLLKWDLKEIINIIHKGKNEFEFNFISGWHFIIHADLQHILASLLSAQLPNHTVALNILRKDISSAVDLWIKGFIDNFTYICYLNVISGRSYCDFNKYPVFPQIYCQFEEMKLRDLSKPIGQLDEDRSNNFDSAYESNNHSYYYEESFMDESVVFSFLSRFDPFRILSLNTSNSYYSYNNNDCNLTNSKFSKDFVQFDLKSFFESTSAVMEAVPQLYIISDVSAGFNKIPPWCSQDNPNEDFVSKSMAILHSDETTQKLPKWIDLIFGYLINSHEAKNVFSPKSANYCYQIFKRPHEKVHKKKHLTHFDHILSDCDKIVYQKLNTLAFQFPIVEFAFSNNEDSTMIYSIQPSTAFVSPNLILSIAQSQRSILKNGSQCLKTSQLFKTSQSISISPDLSFCAITQMESVVTIWQINYENNNPIDLKFISHFQLDDFNDSEKELNRVSLSLQKSSSASYLLKRNIIITEQKVKFSSIHFLAIAISDKKIVRFDLGRRRLIDPIEVKYKINSCCIDDFAGRILTCGDKEFTIFTIGGKFICHQQCGMKVCQIAVSNLPVYVKNRFIVTGHSDGYLIFWSYDTELGVIKLLAQRKVTQLPIKSISIDNTATRIIISTETNEIFCFDFLGTPKQPVSRNLILGCAQCNCPYDASQFRFCSKCKRWFCKSCLVSIKKIYPTARNVYSCKFCIEKK